jgi:hypothetical protein
VSVAVEIGLRVREIEAEIVGEAGVLEAVGAGDAGVGGGLAVEGAADGTVAADGTRFEPPISAADFAD